MTATGFAPGLDYIGTIDLGANLYSPPPTSSGPMERKLNVETNEDFEAWKLYRFEAEETHQAEFALK